MTVTWVRGKNLKLVGRATAHVGQPARLSGTIPKNVTAIIVELETPIGGEARVTIAQGAKRIEDATPFMGDLRFSFDVAP